MSETVLNLDLAILSVAVCAATYFILGKDGAGEALLAGAVVFAFPEQSRIAIVAVFGLLLLMRILHRGRMPRPRHEKHDDGDIVDAEFTVHR